MTNRLILGFTLVVAVLVGIVIVLGRKESVGEAMTNYMECFDKRDAECMLRYATEEEVMATGLTAKGLQQMLDTWVSPNLEGYTASQLTPGNSSGFIESERHFRKPDMAMTHLRQPFFIVDGRPKTRILQPLVELVTGSYQPYRTFMMEEGYTRLKADMPKLQALPMPGYVEIGNIGTYVGSSSPFGSASLNMEPRVGKLHTWHSLLSVAWTQYSRSKSSFRGLGRRLIPVKKRTSTGSKP